MEDVLEKLPKKIDILDTGYVELLESCPRLVPIGRTIEDAIVKSARISYDRNTSSVTADSKLIEYLIRNMHTSPLEQVSFQFKVKVPKFVSIQLLRHRTFKFNEFSQRYCKVDTDYYHPSRCSDSIRGQDSINKQKSGVIDQEQKEIINELVVQTEGLLDQIFVNYDKMIELGLAREVARFCLPLATYTKLVFTADLHNLMKFTVLRDSTAAQPEIVVVAHAMWELISPLIPTVSRVFDDIRNGLTLSASELSAFVNKEELETDSVSTKNAYIEKVKRLSPN